MTRTSRPRKSRAQLFAVQIVVISALSWAGAAGAFEQDQRFNSFTMQFGTDTFATANAFGHAFTSTTQGQLQTAIASKVDDGSFSLLFEFPGLADLTGTAVPALQFGVVTGSPMLDTNNPTPYSGASDVDWWYTADPSAVDAMGVPKTQMTGSVAAKAFSATAAELVMTSNPLGNGPMSMSSVVIKATVGSSSAPLESTNGFPPGHLPSEYLDPGLVSFTSTSAGQMKGNVSAASLAAMPYNFNITTDQGYNSSNSILDLLVSGATTFGGLVRLVNPTQPDQSDPSAPVAGAGPPYTFTANAAHVVTVCRDKTGTVVDLATALNSAAYSAYFKFTTDRVIAHNVASNALAAPALSIARDGTNVALTVTAQDTVTCTIEYKQLMDDPNWNWLETFTGTGAPTTVTDSNATDPARFYRAKVQ